MQRGFTTQRNFGAIDAENAWIAARRGESSQDRPSGEKAQFHQPVSELVRKLDPLYCRGLAGAQFCQAAVRFPTRVLSDTELHLTISMRFATRAVNAAPARDQNTFKMDLARSRLRARIAE